MGPVGFSSEQSCSSNKKQRWYKCFECGPRWTRNSTGSRMALPRIHCCKVPFSLRKWHLSPTSTGHVNSGTGLKRRASFMPLVPERTRHPETIQPLEDSIHREENCFGIVARFYPDPCGFLRAGSNSRRTTTPSLRAARPTSRRGIRMAKRLPPLRRRPVRLDSRPLRSSAT